MLGDDRNEPREKKEQEGEAADRSPEKAPVPERGRELVPDGGNEILIEADHDDGETLSPHRKVDQDSDAEEQDRVHPDPLEPKRLDHDEVHEEREPVDGRVLACPQLNPIVHFELVSAVPGGSSPGSRYA